MQMEIQGERRPPTKAIFPPSKVHLSCMIPVSSTQLTYPQGLYGRYLTFHAAVLKCTVHLEHVFQIEHETFGHLSTPQYKMNPAKYGNIFT